VTPPSPRFERWPLGSIHSCSVLPQSSIDSLLSGSRKCAKPSSLVIGELFACFIKDQLHQGFFASAGEVIRDRAPLWPGGPAHAAADSLGVLADPMPAWPIRSAPRPPWPTGAARIGWGGMCACAPWPAAAWPCRWWRSAAGAHGGACRDLVNGPLSRTGDVRSCAGSVVSGGGPGAVVEWSGPAEFLRHPETEKTDMGRVYGQPWQPRCKWLA